MISNTLNENFGQKSSCLNPDLENSDGGCVHCQVRKLFLFSALTKDELELLNIDRNTVNYQAGDMIYKEGSPPQGLLCLSKGKVKIEKENLNGGTQIIALRDRSEFIGFADLLSQSHYTSSAIALEDCTVCLIPLQSFMQVLKSNYTLAFKTIEYLAMELLRANERTADLTQKHMRARLADAILYTHEKYQSEGSDLNLRVMLKRSELAALSNMTTANAIRTLTEFSKDNLVELDGRQITIKNLKELRKISSMG